MPHASDQRFHQLMLRYAQEIDPQRRAELEQTLWQEYGKTCSVCVIDMSGFTRITQRYGVVHYLSMITRMQLTAAPVIQNHGGTVVKFEADNCFATFIEPVDAIRACISLNIAFNAANLLTEDDQDVRIACGIDHGDILMPHPADFFGNSVNRASKLGEDLAEAGDILVTATAMERVPECSGIIAAPASFNVSGLKIEAFSVSYA